MDFGQCEPIQLMLEERVALADLGYPPEASSARLAEVFSERARRRFDWKIDPCRVEILTDVVQGMYVALRTLTEPGEAAIVQTPVYPPFRFAVTDCERRLIVNELRQGGTGYEMDLDALRRCIDPATRMLLFCNPQNPTGRAFSRMELEALAAIVLEHDLIVCSDEIHADLVYPDSRHIPFASISPEVAARTLTLSSATKAFNIAGLRCAVAAFGSGELQARFNTLPAHLRGGLGSLGLAATALAWTEAQAWLDEVVAYLDANRRFVAEFVADKLPGVVHHSPEATYLAWLDTRGLDIEPDPYQFFLDQARVALSDGRAFGAGGDGFVRLNFATSRHILTTILKRMAAAVAQRR